MITIPDWIPEAVAYIAIAASGGLLTYNNAKFKRLEDKHDKEIKAIYGEIKDCSSDVYARMDKHYENILLAIKELKGTVPSLDACEGVQRLFDSKLNSHMELEISARQTSAVALEQLAQSVDNLRDDVSDMKTHLMVKR